MKKRKSSNSVRPVVSAVFAAVIAMTVAQNGRGPLTSVAAGILGGGACYFVMRFVIDA